MKQNIENTKDANNDNQNNNPKLNNNTLTRTKDKNIKKQNNQKNTKSNKKEKKNNKNNFEFINYFQKNRKSIILITSSILFIFITLAIFNDKIATLDSIIQSYILSIRSNSLTSTMLIITNLSSAYALIALTIILVFIIKNKKIPLYISLNLICSFLLNQLTKLIFTRPRPIGINLIEESGFSYPSGHAMVSMAYYGFIAYLLYKKQNNKFTKSILIISLIFIILLVGFSRIYLGVHYLSDVIGGFLLSIVYLMIYIKCINLEKK